MTSRIGPRVAVVGTGPRALWALERLDALLERPGSRPLHAVEIFGVGEVGAGRVYDVTQPSYLRLNVASSVVDAWAGDRRRGPAYPTWAAAAAPSRADDPYPPRALAGRYLREQGRRVTTSLCQRLGGRVVRHDQMVERVEPAASGWTVDGQGPFDEVLLAVGHSADWGGALRHHWSPHLPPLHDTVFPVPPLVARPEIRPGASVLVRGAALTAIDAVAALTVGRHQRPAERDLRITLVSRTGRLMLPKSEPAVVASRVAEVRGLSGYAARVIGGWDVPEAVTELAAELLGGARPAHRLVRDAWAALASDDAVDPGAAAGWLRHALEMARGQAPPDGAWALGQAWRALYPALVERQRSCSSGHPLCWPDFASGAAALERLAFGPPAVNAELLLDGLAAGTVQVGVGDVRDRAGSADLVVDAVLPPPGIVDLPRDSLLGRLRDGRVLSRDPVRRGARVASDGTVLGPSGARASGLALVGRATEDHVLGNDTLARDLHPEIETWAARVLGLTPGAGP